MKNTVLLSMRTNRLSLLFFFSFFFACARGQGPVTEHPVAKQAQEACIEHVKDAGVWSDLGDPARHKRMVLDLNHDGKREVALADKKLCQQDNCYWNLYQIENDGCTRYLGVVSGADFDIDGPERSGKGFGSLQTRWVMSDSPRVFLQKYVFDKTEYQLRQATLCLVDADGNHLCEERIH